MNFLQDRQVIIGVTKKKYNQGIPQGSCLGPILWNLYINDVLKIDLGPNSAIQAFADDIVVMFSAPATFHFSTICPTQLNKIQDWISALQVLSGIPPISYTLRSLQKIFYIRTLRKDIQIGDNTYRAEDLEEDTTFMAPWMKTRTPWRDLQPVEGGHCIYTDGSKKEDRVGSAIVLLKENVENYHHYWRLNDEATVFMAELHAIHKAIEFLSDNSLANAKIISDSRSVLMALDNPANNSPAIFTVKELLKVAQYPIEMVWTKAHIGITGNELADAYAKLGTEKPVIDSFHRLPISFIKKKLKESITTTWQQQWSTSTKGRDVHQLCPTINLNRIHGNFYLNQIITGHGAIGTHQHRFFNANSVCLCGVEEDKSHIVYKCKRWTKLRKKYFPVNYQQQTLLQLLSNKKARTGMECIMKEKLSAIMQDEFT
ncbi:uncharacterized protein CDAR_189441 [Caerostris darwini]|uniref:RNase H type-1 domain-containing protein n=1 Tax=Caerostris darwini TaxID=1538125 RepID=A0AAV4TI08_9ARAC|nr:uncharacterized protein CDAR_189441 [Caerostris darwini]